MKNLTKLFGTIALITVIGFSFAACDNGDGGGSGGAPQTATYSGVAGGTTYTLKITETARYAAQSGDAYELTAGSKKSAGTVQSVSSGVLTLKPSNASATFTVTVSGNSITAMGGTITWTDNTTDAAPDGLTGGGGTGSGGIVGLWYADRTFVVLMYEFTAGGVFRFYGGSSSPYGTGTYSVSGNTITATINISGVGIEQTAKFSISGNDLTLSNCNGSYLENGTYYRGSSTNPGTGTGGGNITWTKVEDSTFSILYGINAIAYGGGKFVAGAKGRGGRMAYSADGVIWTAVADSTFGTDEIVAIAYGGGKFVAGGSSGKMAYSSNGGVTWTAIPAGTGAGTSTFGYQYIDAIVYGNNRFFAGGGSGKMAYSSDGVNWTPVANSPFGIDGVNAIAYGGGTFVAASGRNKMAYSSDGINWTLVANSPFGVDGVNAIAYGSGKFVAVGYTGETAYSSNGVTWTAVNVSSIFGTGTPGDIDSIAYDNGKFVAGGYDCKTAYSSDGVTWTAITKNSQISRIEAIAYGNGKFVIGDNFGRIAYSSGL